MSEHYLKKRTFLTKNTGYLLLPNYCCFLRLRILLKIIMFAYFGACYINFTDKMYATTIWVK